MSKHRRRQGYAIVRVDEFLPDETSLENKITVKRILWDFDTAVSEVARLNELRENSTYFWQATRVDIPDDWPDVETKGDDRRDGDLTPR